MTDKFKPLDSNPGYVYHVDYWSTVAQDTFESFWNLVIWAFTGRFPVTPGHVIKYCGNPECYSLIAFYPDKRPSSCSRCGKEIDWGLIITTPLVNMVESPADYINAKHTVGWNIIIAMLAIVL